MLDALGAPWPKHDCFYREYQEVEARAGPILRRGADPKSGRFKPFAELGEMFGIDVNAAPPSEASAPIEKESKAKVAPEAKEHPIKRMEPVAVGERQSVVGIIRERGSRTDRLERMYAALGSIGRKAFGLPAEARAVQLTIVDVEGKPNESYSCIADAALLDASLVKGVMVWVTLRGNVVGSTSAWIVEEIHPL